MQPIPTITRIQKHLIKMQKCIENENNNKEFHQQSAIQNSFFFLFHFIQFVDENVSYFVVVVAVAIFKSIFLIWFEWVKERVREENKIHLSIIQFSNIYNTLHIIILCILFVFYFLCSLPASIVHNNFLLLLVSLLFGFGSLMKDCEETESNWQIINQATNWNRTTKKKTTEERRSCWITRLIYLLMSLM